MFCFILLQHLFYFIAPEPIPLLVITSSFFRFLFLDFWVENCDFFTESIVHNSYTTTDIENTTPCLKKQDTLFLS